MKFCDALLHLEAGARVARAGWNGKGMWIYQVPAANYPAQTEAAKEYWKDKGTGFAADGVTPLVPYGAYLAMKTAQENVVPWLASQTDILAEDWELLS